MQIFSPRDYQTLAIGFLRDNPRCALFAEMGLGKTVSTLTLLNELVITEGAKILVVAPLRVAASTWGDEVGKWAHLAGLRLSNLLGNAKQREEAYQAQADIYTINYEGLPWLIEQHLADFDFDVIVADESTNLKSFRTRQGSKRAGLLARIAFKVDRFIELTGTPSPNGLLDLWGQMYFLDQGMALGKSYTAYKNRHFLSIRVGKSIHAVRYQAINPDEIADLIKPLSLTLRSADYFDLNKPIIVNIPVTLPQKVGKLYRKFERELLVELESGKNLVANNAASLSMKCLQVAAGAVYTEAGFDVLHDEKIHALESVVNECNGENLLVAYNFKSDLARILKKFPHARVLDRDPQTIIDWNAGLISMLLLHPASGGHGLSLRHGGSRIVIFSPNWNLEQYQQVVERIGVVRQKQSGYDRNVFIYNIVAAGTIDELVISRREGKRDIQEMLLERLKKNFENDAECDNLHTL